MRYKLLGKSGLRVSELALGTMTFGEDWGWGADKAESRKIFEAYLEAGGNFIDTSINYTNGTSERFVGELLATAAREELVVATKYTLTTRPNDPNGGGNSRKNMVQSVETSLKRLGTDYLDLFWLHMWDYTTPVEEVMRGLDDLVRAGKVLYIGISDTPAWVVAQANTLAELRGWSRFVALQLPYSLDGRSVEADLLPMAKHFDMAVTAWGTLSGGLLTGKYSVGGSSETKRHSDVKVSERQQAIVDEVIRIAEETGRPRTQIAINWVRQQQHRALVIPILGARKAEQLKDNLGCLDFELTTEQLSRLDQVSKLDLGFPHTFWSDPSIKQYIFGNTYPLIDNHRSR
jgi:aryl-alcohol dehydrogenase-like predicted oxidoreductase